MEGNDNMSVLNLYVAPDELYCLEYEISYNSWKTCHTQVFITRMRTNFLKRVAAHRALMQRGDIRNLRTFIYTKQNYNV